MCASVRASALTRRDSCTHTPPASTHRERKPVPPLHVPDVAYQITLGVRTGRPIPGLLLRLGFSSIPLPPLSLPFASRARRNPTADFSTSALTSRKSGSSGVQMPTTTSWGCTRHHKPRHRRQTCTKRVCSSLPPQSQIFARQAAGPASCVTAAEAGAVATAIELAFAHGQSVGKSAHLHA